MEGHIREARAIGRSLSILWTMTVTGSNDSCIDFVPVDDNKNLLQSLRRTRKVNSNFQRRLFSGRLMMLGMLALSAFILQVSKLHLSMWNNSVQQQQPMDGLDSSWDEAASSDSTEYSYQVSEEGIDLITPSPVSEELSNQLDVDETPKSRHEDRSKRKSHHSSMNTKSAVPSTNRRANSVKSNLTNQDHSHSGTDRVHVESKSKTTKRDRKLPSKQELSWSSSHLLKIHPIFIQPDEVFLWNGAQRRLCDHIKKELSTLHGDNKKRIGLFLKIPCLKVHQRNQHGNVLVGYYGMRVAAMAFNASFTFQCVEDASTLQKQTYFGWLQSQEHSKTTTKGSNRTLPFYHVMRRPTKKEACKGMGKVALQYSSEYVRRDLRRMADELSTRLAPTLDEAAIHWRCGDVLSGKIPKKDQNYGLLKFQAYTRRIPDNVRSIGIVTAPFSSRYSRKEDREYGSDCKYIAGNLVSYLQRHYPNAAITIRNDASEMIPQVLSRFILANYTFCARSTFCLFPALASYGQSFVQQGGVAYFFNSIAQQTNYDNIHMMDEPVVLSYEVLERGINKTVEWLLSDEVSK